MSLIKIAGWALPLQDYLTTNLVPKRPHPNAPKQFHWHLDLNKYLGEIGDRRVREADTARLPYWARDPILNTSDTFDDLWFLVEYGNERHVTFFPTSGDKDQCLRMDNRMDMIMAPHEPIQSFCKYLEQSHFPHQGAGFMDANGIDYSAPPPDGNLLIPAPPIQLRWWLTEFRVLSLKGISRLRPLLARYYIE